MKPGLPFLMIGVLLLAPMLCCPPSIISSPTPRPSFATLPPKYTDLPSSNTITPSTTAPKTPIGSITRVSDVVMAGPEGSLSSVDNYRSLYDNDAVHVEYGGKADLDMGNGVNFTLFNETITNQTKVDNVSLEVWMNLSQGGLRGINPPGSRTEVSLLGNVNIVILGTSYFIVSDPDKGQAWIYNYDGTVHYSFGGGQTQNLPARNLLIVSSSDVIQILPNQGYSVDDFDRYATSGGDPYSGLRDLLDAYNKPTSIPNTPSPTPTHPHLPPPTKVLLLTATNTPTIKY